MVASLLMLCDFISQSMDHMLVRTLALLNHGEVYWGYFYAGTCTVSIRMKICFGLCLSTNKVAAAAILQAQAMVSQGVVSVRISLC